MLPGDVTKKEQSVNVAGAPPATNKAVPPHLRICRPIGAAAAAAALYAPPQSLSPPAISLVTFCTRALSPMGSLDASSRYLWRDDSAALSSCSSSRNQSSGSTQVHHKFQPEGPYRMSTPTPPAVGSPTHCRPPAIAWVYRLKNTLQWLSITVPSLPMYAKQTEQQ
jgi:hypothetical protein